jgi:flagellar basal-body rod protein FlgC
MISASQAAALTGLQAFTTKLQSNANNIANSDTNGFKKTVVTNSSISPQGVKTQVNQVTTPGPTVYQETEIGMEPVELSNVDLAKEIVDMNLNSTMYKANLKTLESVNDMTGMLLKLKS